MRTIVINPGTAEAWTFPLTDGVVVVGRSPSCDLVLDHESILEKHAEVHVLENYVTVIALDETGQISVDDQSMEKIEIDSERRIKMGNVELGFTFETPRRPSKISQPSSTADANRAGFMTALASSYVYPLHKEGIYIILAGAVGFSIVDFVASHSLFFEMFIRFAIIGYTAAFVKSIICSSAMGGDTLPRWPDLENCSQDIMSPFFLGIVNIAVSFGPIALLNFNHSLSAEQKLLALVLCCAWGFLSFPILAIAASLTDSIFTALNPIPLLRAIQATFSHYLVICAVFTTVVFAGILLEQLEQHLPRIPFLITFVSALLHLYLLCLFARAFGLFYKFNHSRIGWFSYK